MATYLIIQSDFDDYRKITSHLAARYNDRVRPYVLEAQISDLRGVLTKNFYNEVISVADSGVDHPTGLTKVNYDLLLPYIKPVLVYFTWARLLENNQVTMTVNSVVQKTNEFSTPTSNAQRTAAINSAQSMAQVYVNDMLEYIDDNRAKFATYHNNISKSDRNRTSIRISGVDNTYYNGENRYNKHSDY